MSVDPFSSESTSTWLYMYVHVWLSCCTPQGILQPVGAEATCGQWASEWEPVLQWSVQCNHWSNCMHMHRWLHIKYVYVWERGHSIRKVGSQCPPYSPMSHYVWCHTLSPIPSFGLFHTTELNRKEVDVITVPDKSSILVCFLHMYSPVQSAHS